MYSQRKNYIKVAQFGLFRFSLPYHGGACNVTFKNVVKTLVAESLLVALKTGINSYQPVSLQAGVGPPQCHRSPFEKLAV